MTLPFSITYSFLYLFVLMRLSVHCMLYTIAHAGSSLLTILTPLAARHSTTALIVVRVLEGFGEGVTFPAFHAVLGRWVPYNEKTKISTFVYAGP